jgi:hypothetical protein
MLNLYTFSAVPSVLSDNEKNVLFNGTASFKNVNNCWITTISLYLWIIYICKFHTQFHIKLAYFYLNFF